MEQAPFVFKDTDSRFEQCGVVTMACGCHEPRVVLGRHDQGRFDPSATAGAQGRLHGLIGNIVRGRDDQFVSCGVHERFEHLRHRRIADRRAGSNHLSDQARAMLGPRFED